VAFVFCARRSYVQHRSQALLLYASGRPLAPANLRQHPGTATWHGWGMERSALGGGTSQGCSRCCPLMPPWGPDEGAEIRAALGRGRAEGRRAGPKEEDHRTQQFPHRNNTGRYYCPCPSFFLLPWPIVPSTAFPAETLAMAGRTCTWHSMAIIIHGDEIPEAGPGTLRESHSIRKTVHGGWWFAVVGAMRKCSYGTYEATHSNTYEVPSTPGFSKRADGQDTWHWMNDSPLRTFSQGERPSPAVRKIK
jgi:hypothetical protein